MLPCHSEIGGFSCDHPSSQHTGCNLLAQTYQKLVMAWPDHSLMTSRPSDSSIPCTIDTVWTVCFWGRCRWPSLVQARPVLTLAFPCASAPCV